MRYRCTQEPNCEQAWEGLNETVLKTSMALHMGEKHGVNLLTHKLKISPMSELHEDDSPVEPDDSKLDRDSPEVNYRYSSDPAKSCGQCAHFSLPGACELVKGAIRSVDSCNLWEQAAHPKVDPEGHPTGAGGGRESIRSFEAAYSDEFTLEESSALPRAKNQADKNFSVNETVQRLRSAGWTLADHDKDVAVFRHPKLEGHTLAVHHGRGRFEHRDEAGALIARQKVGMLAEYGEAAPGALGQFTEAVRSFFKAYD